MGTNVDKKNVATFTEDEKILLERKASSLAKKYGCSSKYVNQIKNGERELNSELAKKIYRDLVSIINFFKPIENV